jgi:hypothetical protein
MNFPRSQSIHNHWNVSVHKLDAEDEAALLPTVVPTAQPGSAT